MSTVYNIAIYDGEIRDERMPHMKEHPRIGHCIEGEYEEHPDGRVTLTVKHGHLRWEGWGRNNTNVTLFDIQAGRATTLVWTRPQRRAWVCLGGVESSLAERRSNSTHTFTLFQQLHEVAGN